MTENSVGKIIKISILAVFLSATFTFSQDEAGRFFPFGLYCYSYLGILPDTNSNGFFDVKTLDFWYNNFNANLFMVDCSDSHVFDRQPLSTGHMVCSLKKK